MIEIFLLLTLHPHARHLELRQAEGFYRYKAHWSAYHEAYTRGVPLVEWRGVWPRTQGLDGYVHVYHPHAKPEVYVLRMRSCEVLHEKDGASCGYSSIGYFPTNVPWGEIKFAIDLDEIEWKEERDKKAKRLPAR